MLARSFCSSWLRLVAAVSILQMALSGLVSTQSRTTPYRRSCCAAPATACNAACGTGCGGCESSCGDSGSKAKCGDGSCRVLSFHRQGAGCGSWVELVGCGGCAAGGACGGVGRQAKDCWNKRVYTPAYQLPAHCKASAVLDDLAKVKTGSPLTALRSLATMCMRPELKALVREAKYSTSMFEIALARGGCPDHAYFRNTLTASPESCKQAVQTQCGGACSTGGCCGGGCCAAQSSGKCCSACKATCGCSSGGCTGQPSSCAAKTSSNCGACKACSKCSGAPKVSMSVPLFRAVTGALMCPASIAACQLALNSTAVASLLTCSSKTCCAGSGGCSACSGGCNVCGACGGCGARGKRISSGAHVRLHTHLAVSRSSTRTPPSTRTRDMHRPSDRAHGTWIKGSRYLAFARARSKGGRRASCAGGCRAGGCCAAGASAGCCSSCATSKCCSGASGCSTCTTTCGSTGTCDGCVASASHKEQALIGEFDPIERALTFSFPSRPSVRTCEDSSACAVDPPATLGGIVGLALNGVAFVHHHLRPNGSRTAHSLTMTFDDCGGHSDTGHRYHYHLAPLCLLRAYNSTVPARADWWMAPHPESLWPPVSEKRGGQLSPLVGWAIDGHPIFGPYDPETGQLQVAQQGCANNSALDKCNGKTLRNGVYAYFLTPNYPYLPSCLRGRELGVFEEEEVDAQKMTKCPVEGYAPMTWVNVTDCRMGRGSAIVFGMLWLFALAALIFNVHPMVLLMFTRAEQGDVGDAVFEFTLDASLLVFYASLLVLCLLRGLFFLVSPYNVYGVWSSELAGLVTGFWFPLVTYALIYHSFVHHALSGRNATILIALTVVMYAFNAYAASVHENLPTWLGVLQVCFNVFTVVLIVFAARASKLNSFASAKWDVFVITVFLDVILNAIKILDFNQLFMGDFAVLGFCATLRVMNVFLLIVVVADWVKNFQIETLAQFEKQQDASGRRAGPLGVAYQWMDLWKVSTYEPFMAAQREVKTNETILKDARPNDPGNCEVEGDMGSGVELESDVEMGYHVSTISNEVIATSRPVD